MMNENKNRLLIFDILRIISIILIVTLHVAEEKVPSLSSFLSPLLTNIGIGNIINDALGNWGIIIFIIVSGAVIEYTYGPKLNSNFNYRNFMEKRLIRVYPAYWFSLGLAIVFDKLFLNLPVSLVEFLKSFTGFQTYFQEQVLGGEINGVGWFVGLIVVMYLLYPMLSKILKEYGFPALFSIILLSYFIGMSLPTGAQNTPYWCPLARLSDFALGIYIIQAGKYPRYETKSQAIKFLSDLSFPMFLTNFFLARMFRILPDENYLNVVVYVFALFFFSLVVYYFDIWFKTVYDTYRNRTINDLKRLYKLIYIATVNTLYRQL